MKKKIVSLLLALSVLLSLFGFMNIGLAASFVTITEYCDPELSKAYTYTNGVEAGSFPYVTDKTGDFGSGYNNCYFIGDGEQEIVYKFNGDVKYFYFSMLLNKETAANNKWGTVTDAYKKEAVQDFADNAEVLTSADGITYAPLQIEISGGVTTTRPVDNKDAQLHAQTGTKIFGPQDSVNYDNGALGYGGNVNVMRLANSNTFTSANYGKDLPGGIRFIKLKFKNNGYGANCFALMRSYFYADIVQPKAEAVYEKGNYFDLTFNEAMKDSTVIPSNISIDNGMAVTSVEKNDGFYRVYLSKNLAKSMVYTVTLGNAIVSSSYGLNVSNPILKIDTPKAAGTYYLEAEMTENFKDIYEHSAGITYIKTPKTGDELKVYNIAKDTQTVIYKTSGKIDWYHLQLMYYDYRFGKDGNSLPLDDENFGTYFKLYVSEDGKAYEKLQAGEAYFYKISTDLKTSADLKQSYNPQAKYYPTDNNVRGLILTNNPATADASPVKALDENIRYIKLETWHNNSNAGTLMLQEGYVKYTVTDSGDPEEPDEEDLDLRAEIKGMSNHSSVNYFDVKFNKEMEISTITNDSFSVLELDVTHVQRIGKTFRVYLSESMEKDKEYHVSLSDKIKSTEGLGVVNNNLVIRCVNGTGSYTLMENGTDLCQAYKYKGDFKISDDIKKRNVNALTPTSIDVPAGNSSITYEISGKIEWYYFQLAANTYKFEDWINSPQSYVNLYASSDGENFISLAASTDYNFHGNCTLRNDNMDTVDNALPSGFRGTRLQNHPTFSSNLNKAAPDIRYLKLEFVNIPSATSLFLVNSYVKYSVRLPYFTIMNTYNDTENTTAVLEFSNMMDEETLDSTVFTIKQGNRTYYSISADINENGTAAVVTFDDLVNLSNEYTVYIAESAKTRAQELLWKYFANSIEVMDEEAFDKLQDAAAELKIYQGDITSGIPLDTLGMHEAVISWTSSDPSVIDQYGNVYASVGVSHDVNLTARIICEGLTYDKVFNITVPAVNPYVVKGIAVTGSDGVVDNSLAGGKVISSVKLKKFTDSIEDIDIICALYDGNRLVKAGKATVKTDEVNQYETKNFAVELELPASVDNLTAKIMVLDSVKTLKPLADFYTANPLVTENITVYMAGDSLMQTYANGSYYPRYGWGQVLQTFFNESNVKIDNTYSMGGRSSKSFIRENRLQNILNKIKPGDYLFVQFGHNDARDVHDLKTNLNLNSSYTKYLQIYVDLAEAKGANVVLLSSVTRCLTSAADLEYRQNNLSGYPEAMKSYADENEIRLVDLTESTMDTLQDLALKGISPKNLYCYFTLNDARYDTSLIEKSENVKDNNLNDRTHINIYGANVVAQLAVQGLIETGHPLSRYVRTSSFFDIEANMPQPLWTN